MKQILADPSVEPKIYPALVDALFQNALAMFSGAVCATLAMVLTAYKTGNWLLWPCALLTLLIGAVRAYDMHLYSKCKGRLSLSGVRSWERRYGIGAALYAGALGLWSFIILAGNEDHLSQMLCASVTLAYTAAGSGRNYSRPLIARGQIVLACGPMALALLMHGDIYYVAFALFVVLFFVGLSQIADSLYQVYVRALIASERVTSIADQFDTALNNMPNGLCMFGPDGRLAVVNACFAEMLGLPKDLDARRLTVDELVSECAGVGALSSSDGGSILEDFAAVARGEKRTCNFETTSGSTFEWTFQPMPAGGTVVLVEDITERRDAEERINHMARFDDLTELPNRLNFRAEIERTLNETAEAPLSALLFIDLDQFKQVNDTLGHPCGDQLLRSVASRLRSMLGPDQMVARFGGDEFVVFQPNIRGMDDAAALAARIVNRLSERYAVDHHLVEIGASIGIATTATSGTDVDTLLRHADMALYRAKTEGRATFCFFRPEMEQVVETRRTLEIELRHALANEEFEIFYQPLVQLQTGRISTCEALLRWHHPARGYVSPAEIIPIAEEMGLIVDLGRWILRKACMECMNWPAAVSVAVNFSSQQFHRRDVLTDVRLALEVSGLPPSRLEIEITESSLLRNSQWTLDVLAQLRAMGVRISLDDFGTGYSSLSYLNKFPLQKVKIDRSFLEGIEQDRPRTLLRGVARLSADLGMSVVVEGVETSEQLELIAEDGTITEAQGYLFSPPVPYQQVRELLDASHGRRARPGSRSVAAAG